MERGKLLEIPVPSMAADGHSPFNQSSPVKSRILRGALTNNAAERALRGIALGRKSWLFAGSDRGGVRAAAMYTLIGTAKLNNVDPQAWLADVLDRIAGTPQSQLDELLPWNWQDSQRHDQAA